MERDYLGRWSPKQADDYLHSSREICLRVQAVVRDFVAGPKTQYCEAGIRQEVVRQLGPLAQINESLLETIYPPGRWRGGAGEEPVGSEKKECTEEVHPKAAGKWGLEGAPIESGDDPEARCDEESFAEEAERLRGEEPRKGELGQLWIGQTKQGKSLCLHVLGGCFRRPGIETLNYQWVDQIEEGDYTSWCKQCWLRGEARFRCGASNVMKLAEQGVPIGVQGSTAPSSTQRKSTDSEGSVTSAETFTSSEE